MGSTFLRTNLRLHPLNVMLRYRDLLVVEHLFRSEKALLATRPIYHQTDAAIRGHVFCSFLALVLRKELEERLTAARLKPEWRELLAAPRRSVAGLGNAALASRATAGMLGRHQAEIRHELAGIGEARDVAELSHQSGCGHQPHAAQRLQGFQPPVRETTPATRLRYVPPVGRAVPSLPRRPRYNLPAQYNLPPGRT